MTITADRLDEVVTALRTVLRDEQILTSKPDRYNRARVPAPFPVHRWAERVPDLAVLPTSTEEVAAVVKIANDLRIPVVPRDGGTGLTDGAVPLPTGGARLPLSDVTAIEGYATGGWWVQDFAAQLPATLFGDVAGLHVADLCAAPGGKTMQLAAAGARVTAVEVDAGRAERLKENLVRTRLAERVEVTVADALDVEGAFDAVLLDAPCSATGTLRRQPDVAWAKSPDASNFCASSSKKLMSR